jgi:hypothetical protein
MASLTEEIAERLGGTAGVGVGIAALFLAPRVARPVGRGLRAVAKGAIKGYLLMAHRARAAVDEASDEWLSLFDEARTEVGRAAPGWNGRVEEETTPDTRRPTPDERRTAAPTPSGEAEPLSGVRRQASGAESEAASRVNLNIADRETLMSLPGVGERTAEKILQYRREHGRIRSLQELEEADVLFRNIAASLQGRVEF